MVDSKVLERIYGEKASQAEGRYESLEKNFREKFGESVPEFFSAPGRTEIIGNHTDHNGGRILAASIEMDTIAAAARTDSPVVTIISEGYRDPIVVDTSELDKVPLCKGSVSLVAGILAGALKFGYQIGGFNAYVSTQVISSAGVSSSASFEMLVCAIINHFFNEGKIDYAHYARMGQYAENVYWKKASGLMDQMACAVGGTILLDFGGGDVKVEKVDFDFGSIGYNEVIINTGKGHADLSAEYSSIPNEMREVAHEFGAENLCDVKEEDVLAKIPELREKLGSDRAVMRALHYFEECRRVDLAAAALKEGRKEEMLRLIDDSGRSSFEMLENCYVDSNPKEQSIPMALALSRIYMSRIGAGVCRVHGGGFAGVIMCVLPKDKTEGFVDFMAPYFGRENIYITGIRAAGAVTVE